MSLIFFPYQLGFRGNYVSNCCGGYVALKCTLSTDTGTENARGLANDVIPLPSSQAAKLECSKHVGNVGAELLLIFLSLFISGFWF